jgi:APA family basic amino acid/polyamine antiporter
MAEQNGLKRELDLGSATAMVVGEVIAIGIFLTPAEMTRSLGSPLLVLIVWLALGAMALSGAFCYGELASRFPQAGGGYVYLREAYGPRIAFLYGWECFLVMDPGLTAALAVGLASYAGYIVHLTPFSERIIAIAAVLVIAGANIIGVQAGARLLRGLTVLKLGSLAIIILWGFVSGFGDWSNFTPLAAQRPGSAPLGPALAKGMVAGFFSFGGWWDLNKMAGEVRDASRAMPRAIAFGVAAVTLIYLATSGAFMYLVPLERVTSGETFAAQVGEALFGASGAKIFSSVVIVSVLGSLTAVVMASPRVYYAMARDGLFFRGAGSIHQRFGTPARAISLQAAMASVLVAIGTFQEIIAYFIFITVIFIALTVAAVFVLRRRRESPAYRIPGYPITPLIFLSLVVFLLVLLAINSPRQALLGALVVALGLPVYQLMGVEGDRQLSRTCGGSSGRLETESAMTARAAGGAASADRQDETTSQI